MRKLKLAIIKIKSRVTNKDKLEEKRKSPTDGGFTWVGYGLILLIIFESVKAFL